jgi:hypothetical protein
MNAEQIAAGLNDARKKIVLAMSDALLTAKQIGTNSTLLKSLEFQGLVYRGHVLLPRLTPAYCLTPLGLEVRAVLEKQP